MQTPSPQSPEPSRPLCASIYGARSVAELQSALLRPLGTAQKALGRLENAGVDPYEREKARKAAHLSLDALERRMRALADRLSSGDLSDLR